MTGDCQLKLLAGLGPGLGPELGPELGLGRAGAGGHGGARWRLGLDPARGGQAAGRAGS